MELNKIYNEDCLQLLRQIDDNTIDLIVTSPPYNNGTRHCNNVGRKKNDKREWRQKDYATYSDNMPQDEYVEWQKQVIRECLRVLKSSGSLFYNHKDLLTKGKIIAPTYVYDFPVHQQIVWDRGSSVANDTHYFQPSAEYVYWIVKNTDSFLFKKEEAKFRQMIWRIPFEVNTKHPAPFPEKLVTNIILACSNEGDVVLDPFIGGGDNRLSRTTFAKALYRLGNCTGIC